MDAQRPRVIHPWLEEPRQVILREVILREVILRSDLMRSLPGWMAVNG